LVKKRHNARSWWLTPIVLATWETEIGIIGGQIRQIVCKISIFKTTRAKLTGDVVQAVEFLLCKLKALSSNPSPNKKRKKTQ
jgi:hypothetical protein